MSPPPAVALGFGGGQLIEAALTVLCRVAARGQAAAGPAASATATAASTIVPASLPAGRQAGWAWLSRCDVVCCIIGFLCCRMREPAHAGHVGTGHQPPLPGLIWAAAGS
jgi:hypothetical protein